MKIRNKKVFFDYEVMQEWEAGVMLTGGEVKSAKKGAMSMVGARAVFKGEAGKKPELWLVGVQINPYVHGKKDQDPLRSRKLLLSRKELGEMRVKSEQKGLTLVPLSCYTTHGLVKVKIGLVRGKKKFEKREIMKKKEMKKKLQIALANKV